MVRKICPLFLPNKKNKHRPHLLRHYSLIPLIASFILLQINLALFSSSRPQLLSFATSIYQQDFFALVNKERQTANVSPLNENQALNSAAQKKAVHMFTHNYWAHVAPDGTTPWDFFEKAGYNYSYAGENLAKDFNTSAGVVKGWINSPSHKSNLLNPNFKEMGIAVVNGVLLGKETTLVVQLLGAPYLSYQAVAAPADNKTPSFTPTPTVAATVAPTSAPAIEPTPTTEMPTPTPEPTKVEIYPYSIISTTDFDQGQKPRGIPAVIYHQFTDLKSKSAIAFNPQSWSGAQLITIVFFAILLIVLLGDSFTLWRKGIKRHNSHSMMHACLLGILTLLTMLNSLGSIL